MRVRSDNTFLTLKMFIFETINFTVSKCYDLFEKVANFQSSISFAKSISDPLKLIGTWGYPGYPSLPMILQKSSTEVYRITRIRPSVFCFSVQLTLVSGTRLFAHLARMFVLVSRTRQLYWVSNCHRLGRSWEEKELLGREGFRFDLFNGVPENTAGFQEMEKLKLCFFFKNLKFYGNCFVIDD